MPAAAQPVWVFDPPILPDGSIIIFPTSDISAIRGAADAALARIIANEDRDVCGQFGLRAGTTSFAACSRELANVRQKQSDRDQAAAAGIL